MRAPGIYYMTDHDNFIKIKGDLVQCMDLLAQCYGVCQEGRLISHEKAFPTILANKDWVTFSARAKIEFAAHMERLQISELR